MLDGRPRAGDEHGRAPGGGFARHLVPMIAASLCRVEHGDGREIEHHDGILADAVEAPRRRSPPRRRRTRPRYDKRRRRDPWRRMAVRCREGLRPRRPRESVAAIRLPPHAPYDAGTATRQCRSRTRMPFRQITEDDEAEGRREHDGVAARRADQRRKFPLLGHVPGDDREYGGQSGERDIARERRRDEHEEEQEGRMQEPGDRRARPGSDIGRRARDGSRDANPAE